MSDDYKAGLRTQAEQKIQAEHPNLTSYSLDDFKALVHELQVHQIELELQNDELRRTQGELESLREQYTNLFDYAPVGYFVLNSKKQITQLNVTAAEMLEAPRQSLLGSFFFRVIIESDQEKILFFLNRLIETGLPQCFEAQIVKTDRTIFEALLECVSISYNGSDSYRIALSDITDQKKAEKQALELAMEREHVQILGEFLTNTSHDIKTPLSVLATSLHLLSKSSLSKEQEKRVAKLQNQVTHLIAIIENMFQMSALDTIDKHRFEPINIVEIVQAAVQNSTLISDAKQQTLTLLHDVDSIIVNADHFFIRCVVDNLINNAIAFSPEGETILLSVYAQDSQVVIEIKDHGVGISSEDLPHIFKHFYRSDKSRNMNTGGSGLGLAIAQKIVTAHQGRIEVDSELGEGSLFRVFLPV